MADLRTTAPLAGHGDRPPRLSSPALEIAALAPVGLVWLQVRDPGEALLDGVADVLGFALPRSPNTSAGREPMALSIAPGEWMLTTGDDEAEGLAARISRALEGGLARATNVSDSRAGFQVGGPEAASLLSMGCGLDLQGEVFGAGACTATRFAGIPALLHRTAELESYRLYVDRSCAQYLWDWLAAAAREFAAAAE